MRNSRIMLALLPFMHMHTNEHSLEKIATLEVKHRADSSHYYEHFLYRWCESRGDYDRLVTHKDSDDNRIWLIQKNKSHQERVPFNVVPDLFNTELVDIIFKNTPTQLSKERDGTLQLCDEPAINLFYGKQRSSTYRPIDGWQYDLNQPRKERLFMRPDKYQYAMTQFTHDPAHPQRTIETLSIYSITGNNRPMLHESFKSYIRVEKDRTPKPHLVFDWAPDSQSLAVVDTYHEDDDKHDETITLYGTNNFSCTNSFKVETGGIQELSFSPNSRFLAAYSSGDHEAIRIWNLIHGHLTATLEHEHAGQNFNGLFDTSHTLDHIWNLDSTRIATYNADGNINVYGLPND